MSDDVKTEPTARPWSAERSDGGTWYVLEGVWPRVEVVCEGFSEEDARLIAQAPALLEERDALRAALATARSQVVTLGGDVTEHDGKIVSDPIQAAVLSVIDAALSRAEA